MRFYLINLSEGEKLFWDKIKTSGFRNEILIVNNRMTKVEETAFSPRNSTLVPITIGNVYCFVSYGRCPGGSLVACCGISILKWLVSPLSPVWLGGSIRSPHISPQRDNSFLRKHRKDYYRTRLPVEGRRRKRRMNANNETTLPEQYRKFSNASK